MMMKYGRLSVARSDILLRSQKGESYASIAKRYVCTYQAIQNIVKRNGQRRITYAGKGRAGK